MEKIYILLSLCRGKLIIDYTMIFSKIIRILDSNWCLGMRYSKLARYMPAIKVAAVAVAIATAKTAALAGGDPLPPTRSAF